MWTIPTPLATGGEDFLGTTAQLPHRTSGSTPDYLKPPILSKRPSSARLHKTTLDAGSRSTRSRRFAKREAPGRPGARRAIILLPLAAPADRRARVGLPSAKRPGDLAPAAPSSCFHWQRLLGAAAPLTQLALNLAHRAPIERETPQRPGLQQGEPRGHD